MLIEITTTKEKQTKVKWVCSFFKQIGLSMKSLESAWFAADRGTPAASQKLLLNPVEMDDFILEEEAVGTPKNMAMGEKARHPHAES